MESEVRAVFQNKLILDTTGCVFIGTVLELCVPYYYRKCVQVIE
jgi:hypothetical protein